nr:sigma-70 family RNA polymerase sigma factor [uncultured Blautia sp.]
MMGYQTGTLTGIKTWMVERGIRDRIAVWYLFVEKEKQKIGQIFAVIRKETEQKKAVKIAGKQKAEVLAERILDVYGDAVLRLAYTYVHNMSDAEDILQETLIRYLENRPVFENEKHEKAWLFRVAANLSKNKIAYNKIRQADQLEDQLIVQEREDLTFVWDAVKRLPESYREAIHLYYYEGFPTAQIAEILGKKESSVRSDLRRGREKLREVLREEYDFE